MGIVLAIWIISAIFFGWAGRQVGRPKGRETQGTLFGSVLGLVGVFVIFLLPPITDQTRQRSTSLPAIPAEESPERLRALYDRNLISEAEYLVRSDKLRLEKLSSRDDGGQN